MNDDAALTASQRGLVGADVHSLDMKHSVVEQEPDAVVPERQVGELSSGRAER
jgi:hypothetical protein